MPKKLIQIEQELAVALRAGSQKCWEKLTPWLAQAQDQDEKIRAQALSEIENLLQNALTQTSVKFDPNATYKFIAREIHWDELENTRGPSEPIFNVVCSAIICLGIFAHATTKEQTQALWSCLSMSETPFIKKLGQRVFDWTATNRGVQLVDLLMPTSSLSPPMAGQAFLLPSDPVLQDLFQKGLVQSLQDQTPNTFRQRPADFLIQGYEKMNRVWSSPKTSSIDAPRATQFLIDLSVPILRAIHHDLSNLVNPKAPSLSPNHISTDRHHWWEAMDAALVNALDQRAELMLCSGLSLSPQDALDAALIHQDLLELIKSPAATRIWLDLSLPVFESTETAVANLVAFAPPLNLYTEQNQDVVDQFCSVQKSIVRHQLDIEHAIHALSKNPTSCPPRFEDMLISALDRLKIYQSFTLRPSLHKEPLSKYHLLAAKATAGRLLHEGVLDVLLDNLRARIVTHPEASPSPALSLQQWADLFIKGMGALGEEDLLARLPLDVKKEAFFVFLSNPKMFVEIAQPLSASLSPKDLLGVADRVTRNQFSNFPQLTAALQQRAITQSVTPQAEQKTDTTVKKKM